MEVCPPARSAAAVVDAGTTEGAAPSAAAVEAAPDGGTAAPEAGASTRADVPVAAGSDILVEIRVEGNRAESSRRWSSGR